jgi:hypothetical protein
MGDFLLKRPRRVKKPKMMLMKMCMSVRDSRIEETIFIE